MGSGGSRPTPQPRGKLGSPGKKAPAKKTTSAGSSSAAASPVPVGNMFTGDAKSKEKRVNNDKGGWRFTGEDKLPAMYVAELKEQMDGKVACVALMFTSDFSKSAKALQQITDYLNSDDRDMDMVVNCADMLFKWLAMQMLSTNTTVQSKTVDCCLSFFTRLHEIEYQVSEFEAQCFLPYLSNKVGNPKDNVRTRLRQTVVLVTKICEPLVVFRELVKALMHNKSAKNRSECASACAELITVYGVQVVSPLKQITAIAKNVGDNTVRPAVLGCLVQAYTRMKESDFLALIKSIKGKDRTFIDEKLKRCKPNSVANPTPTVTKKDPPAAAADPAPVKPSPAPAKTPEPKPASPAPQSSNQAAAARSIPSVPVSGDDTASEDMQLMTKRALATGRSSTFQQITGPLSGLPLSQQIQIVFDKIDEGEMSSEDHIMHLRYVSTLLSEGAELNEFSGTNLIDMVVDHLIVSLKNVFYTDPFDGRLCKYVIYTLMTVMECHLAQLISLDIASQVMHDLLLLTVLYSHEEDSQITLLVRALNATVVSYTDNADPTIVLCFMIRLMHSPPVDEQDANDKDLMSRYQNVTTRLVVKQMKKLNDFVAQLDIELLFMEIDRFLTLYTSEDAESEVLDLPNRIVKTIVHSVVKEHGEKTRQALVNISSDEDSTLVHLVDILLEQLAQGGDASQNTSGDVNPGDNMDRLRDLRARVNAQSRKPGDTNGTNQQSSDSI